MRASDGASARSSSARSAGVARSTAALRSTSSPIPHRSACGTRMAEILGDVVGVELLRCGARLRLRRAVGRRAARHEHDEREKERARRTIERELIAWIPAPEGRNVTEQRARGRPGTERQGRGRSSRPCTRSPRNPADHRCPSRGLHRLHAFLEICGNVTNLLIGHVPECRPGHGNRQVLRVLPGSCPDLVSSN